MKIKFILLFFMISLLAINAQETKKEEIPDPKQFVKVDKEPSVIQQIKPVFPVEAAKKRLTGTVVIRVLVNKEGRPQKTQIVMSSNKIFEQPAVDAVMKTLFTPAMQNKKPIMCWVNIPYKFNYPADTGVSKEKPEATKSANAKKKNSK